VNRLGFYGEILLRVMRLFPASRLVEQEHDAAYGAGIVGGIAGPLGMRIS
jgi:hypothetical protein